MGNHLHLRWPFCDDGRKDWGSIALLPFAVPPSSIGSLPLADKGPRVANERPGQICASNRTRGFAKLWHQRNLKSDRAGVTLSPVRLRLCAGKDERDQRSLWERTIEDVRCRRTHGESLWLGQDHHFHPVPRALLCGIRPWDSRGRREGASHAQGSMATTLATCNVTPAAV